MTDATTAPAASTATAGEVLAGYLTLQAGAFARALPLAVGEAGARPGAVPAAAAAGTADLLRAVRRIGGALHTFAPAFEPAWAEECRTELRWLLGLLAQEPGYARRAARLLTALDSLSGTGPEGPGMLAGHPGVPKARALLERQLTLARTRAHTAVLQELRSARLHALADRMTLLAGDAPLVEAVAGRPSGALRPLAAAALAALAAGVEHLPLARVTRPYGRDGLHRLSGVPVPREPVADADAALSADDAPWGRARILVKRGRYALEVCASPVEELDVLDGVLDRHQDAAEAAAAASAAARTPRITPATAYVLGVVHADQRLEVEASRYAFGHQWPHLPHRGWQEWTIAG